MSKQKQLTRLTMMLRFLRGSKKAFFLSILASLLVVGCDMILPQIIRIVVDYGLNDDAAALPVIMAEWLDGLGGRTYLMAHLYLAAAAVILTALASALGKYFRAYMNAVGTERMMKTIRDMLFDHIEHPPYAWHMKHLTGGIIQRCTSDVNEIMTFVSEQLIQVVHIVLLIIFSVVCMAGMSLKLSIIVFISVPVIILYSWIFYYKIGGLFLKCDENEGVLSTIAQENLTGVRVVRAFGRENYERERFGAQNKVYTDTWMKLCAILTGYWAAGDIVTGLQMMLIVVIGAVMCVQGDLSAGGLIAFISYNTRMIWPVRRLGRMLSEMSKAGVSMDRLLYILNSPTEASVLPDGGKKPPMDGDIVFDHVSFSYDGKKKILDDVCLTIPGGKTLGLLGGTGSGKSTLIQLLDRLYDPDQGQIRIGGVDIKEIDRGWLRSHIGMVMQEPYLFSKTVRENIAITKDASLEQVRRAARTAHIDDSFARLTEGYDTMVGERGVTLSGGQRQRTAIARTLMQNAPIMVFDDALSAVDTVTDQKIRQSLKEDVTRRTTLMISHRITTLMDADLIIVMDKGRIVQQGTHETLLGEPGFYKRIYDLQSGLDETEGGGTFESE